MNKVNLKKHWKSKKKTIETWKQMTCLRDDFFQKKTKSMKERK